MSFSSLHLAPTLLPVLNELKFEQATPIQELAIPAILSGKDVMGIAPTGSGKTASYALPILTQLAKLAPSKNRNIPVLILVPTRELAIQVEEVFKLFASALPNSPKIKAVYGGVSINPQMKSMMGVSVLIATPGRLIELLEKNALQLSSLKTLLLDEADKLLNQGFQEEMDQIRSYLPAKRQNCLFSATLNEKVEAITSLLLRDPLVLKVEQTENSVEQIKQTAFWVNEDRKGPLLRYLIKSRNMHQVLVFVGSTFKADAVVEKLRNNKLDAVAIHSKKSQDARTKSLRNFKEGKTRILVATDLISRGIDIEFLPYVINYELPRSPKDYIHRIGRTGRAEATGEAITFVMPEDEHHWKIIQKKTKKEQEHPAHIEHISTEDFDLKGY